MQKLGVVILFLICSLNLVPPLFAEGGAFDVTYKVEQCGNIVTMHGLYFDNVFFTLLYIILMVMTISIPFIFNLSKQLNYISFAFSMWFMTALIFELMNFADPLGVYNSEGSNHTFAFYIIAITLAFATIITYKTWNKQKN